MNELCRKCPGYKKCVGFLWYDYGDIRWCLHQIVFIIQNADDLRIGVWPDPPQYLVTDVVQRRISTQASFVGACSVLAEVEARLKRTGKDGEWLVSLIERECPINGLPPDPKMAFYYITGWDRYGLKYCPLCRSKTKGDICPKHGRVISIKEKRMPYSGWKKQRVYRAKKKGGDVKCQ